jgi:hypothetical protein
LEAWAHLESKSEAPLSQDGPLRPSLWPWLRLLGTFLLQATEFILYAPLSQQGEL